MNEKTETILMNYIAENKENIYRLAYSYVKNKEDALDIVQDAIYKAIRSFDLLNDKAVVKSWFYRIVVNTALDFIRKYKRVNVMCLDNLEFYIPGTEDTYTNIDLVRTVEDMPSRYREVVVLRYFEDLKIEEIADILQLNVNTVKTRLYLALRLLRVRLNDISLKDIM
ncbi:RNA polymerase sigma factor [Paenibacillus glycanilyticus]|uniref:RNA polymerase sigma factor SigV n=1 Tax=Paenibacillus glycanilyticus TaxID=126569 RepID=A0ABQ6GD77_9BACL|nr:RNA polymerase sigma factor [Paenibacillus glycanilyticus]GLX68460.1 RNA polymerase sigma factor SigV [Paenibacillus glycanilyticus]